MSSSLLAVGAGPQVGLLVGRVALQCPAAFVGEAVVVVAEPGGVVDAGGALAAAPDDVVQLAGWVVAVGERAAALVADPGGAALGGGEFVVGLADVEHFTVAAEDDGDELGVAGEPAGGFGADLRAGRGGGPAVAEPPFERFEVHGDDHGAGGAVEAGGVVVGEVGIGEVTERVVLTLPVGPVVVLPGLGACHGERLGEFLADLRRQRPDDGALPVHGLAEVDAAFGVATFAADVGVLVQPERVEERFDERGDVFGAGGEREVD